MDDEYTAVHKLNNKSKTYSKGVNYLIENVYFSAYKLHYKTTLLFFFGCRVSNIQSAQKRFNVRRLFSL